MTTEERLEMYREKKRFIQDTSLAFTKNPSGHTVDDIVYEVLFNEDKFGQYFSEWLIVKYQGGAEARRSISCNSNYANFRAIADVIEGGHYGQNPDYERLLDIGWKKLDITKINELQEENRVD